MRTRVTIVFLLLVNAFLVAGLIWRKGEVDIPGPLTKVEAESASPQKVPEPGFMPAVHPVRSTPFASVYSIRPHEFAANLRQAGCPEETVKDILAAEIGRRYRTLEEELRPTPGDHLPRGWPVKTHEAKIIDRRQRAAEIAREKESFLRQALGYDVKVPIPAYAMTVSDQRFDEMLKDMPQEKRNAAHLANEHYWTMVEQLRARTKGFWESVDVEELERLKAERQSALDALKEETQ